MACLEHLRGLAHLTRHVAVIGAGYAGVTASLTLQRAGIHVTLFEANAVPGGRARRVNDWEDNGQHLCLGAYHALLHQQTRLGLDLTQLYHRMPLTLVDARGEGFRMPRWKAPFHWLGFFLSHRDATLQNTLPLFAWLWRLHRHRWHIVRDIPLSETLATVGLAPCHAGLLQDLCLAALNTPAHRASTQTFLGILEILAKGPQEASDLLIPRVDLSALYPEPAIAALQQGGAEILLGTRVERIESTAEVTLLSKGRRTSVDALIIATHRRGAVALLPSEGETVGALRDLPQERIATLTLGWDSPMRLPYPILRGTGTLHWMVDRGALFKAPQSLFTGVVSALDHVQEEEILSDALRTLETCLGPLPPPQYCHMIHEKLATLSCQPGLKRPPVDTADPRVLLTGDYTHPTLPSTLEGAVQAGEAAANTYLKGCV